MNIIRGIVPAIIAACGWFYLVFAFFMVSWGMSDGGNTWSVSHWAIGLVVWLMPFLISVWIVFRIVGGAKKRAAMAEVSGLVIAALVWVIPWSDTTEQHTFLEKNISITTTNLNETPELPITYEAVGVEMPDGKFNPIMYLAPPTPRGEYKKPLLTVDVRSGSPRIKVYRGTNESVAEDHFLGQYEVSGYPQGKQSLDLLVMFELYQNNDLYMQVRYVDPTDNIVLKAKRVDTSAP